MDHLHEAMIHFGLAREELERAMAGNEYRHQQRVDAAEGRLRQVEREIEAIDEEVRGVSHRGA